jgi:hypothetical protein
MSKHRFNRNTIQTTLLTLALCAAVSVADAAPKKKKKPAKAEKAVPAAVEAAPAVAPVPAPAPAPETPKPVAVPDDLPEAATICNTELATHCMGVVPGGSKIAKCLRDNKPKNSEACNKALYGYLKDRFMGVCGADMKKLCLAESQKTGGLMPCMKAHENELGQECKIELGFAKPAPVPAAAPATAPKK